MGVIGHDSFRPLWCPSGTNDPGLNWACAISQWKIMGATGQKATGAMFARKASNGLFKQLDA